MRVLRMKKKTMFSKLVILSLGLTSVGILIGGFVTGNVFLIGAGAACLFMTCAGTLGIRRTPQAGLV